MNIGTMFKKSLIVAVMVFPLSGFAQTQDVICVGNFVEDVGEPAPGGIYSYSLINLTLSVVAVDYFEVQVSTVSDAGAIVPNWWVDATTYPDKVQWYYSDYATGETTYPLAPFSAVSDFWYTSPFPPIIAEYTILDGNGQEHEGYVVSGGNVTPVELIAFDAEYAAGKVILNWSSSSESGIIGYNIYRNDAQLNESLIPRSVSPFGAEYTFTDTEHASGNYTLTAVGLDGEETVLSSRNLDLISSFSLDQNYPNPFNPSTAINFNLTEGAEVSLDVYNVSGEFVANLAQGQFPAGTHQVTFNADGLSAGTYFYKLTVGTHSVVKSMTLLK